MLREYAGELESLRSMLQATREKNGIYLAPAEYDQMQVMSRRWFVSDPRLIDGRLTFVAPSAQPTQAKLSAQSDKINECEQALRQREEELEEARGVVAGVQGKLDAATEALQRREEELAERWVWVQSGQLTFRDSS